MFVGRKDELKQLEDYYAAEGNSLVVLYGRESVGKTAMTKRFCEGRQTVYYCASDCISILQMKLAAKAMPGADEDGSLAELFLKKLSELPEGKRVLVIDEFQNLDNEPSSVARLVVELFTAAARGNIGGQLMIILVSSSVSYVENEMVGRLGPAARIITGIIKLGELSFSDMVEMLGKTSVSDCIFVRAVFGGVPGYLELWDEKRSREENLYRILMSRRALLENEASHILKSELRELSSYNVILCALAAGNLKLNDIYSYSGFSRAKISVYIKNLIQMDIVEKIFSYDDSGHENLQKGLYRIKDPFISFYYAYVFPYKTDISLGKHAEVYANVVMKSEAEFLRPYFADVCREYLELMSEYGRLEFRYSDFRAWYGKNGVIDIVASDDKGDMLAAYCTYSEQAAGEELYEKLNQLTEEAGIRPKETFMFSRAGFDKEFKAMADKGEIPVKLVALSDL